MLGNYCLIFQRKQVTDKYLFLTSSKKLSTWFTTFFSLFLKIFREGLKLSSILVLKRHLSAKIGSKNTLLIAKTFVGVV